ncbi:cation diffusion facilitator family transporter [Desulfobacula phenolica]|uniref:Cation diffusion facilitator family transporter n=1 Tax=Desulfobacula phenolica TaxID=90732 RepID=A0A1H2J7Z0_9BACT|nr:cation diffusion facilitator family transporter [Desulfobacula phenolica]SDU52422.1 cation diffusion facilitator family transporter [Desulfobacula phenolica]
MNKKNQIQNITLIGLVANIILSVIKFLIGFLGNSQAVVADALHSFSDTSSDLVILFGVKYWTAPPDDDHPYGHQKIESFITIIIGFILILVACTIGYNGIVSLLERKQAQLNWIVTIGPLISIFVKEILFKVTYKVGIKINSSSLKANAWHHRSDAFSSIPVLIAILASLIDPRLGFLDQIGAIIVSAFIVKVGLEIFFTNINDLLDTGISKQKVIELEKTIKTIRNVKGVHKLRTRKLANYIYIDLHLEVDGHLSVIQGHDISEEVKQALIQKNPKIIDVMVHLEPERNLSEPE